MRCAVEGFTVHLLFLIVDDILSRFHSEKCFHGRDGEEADRFLRDFMLRGYRTFGVHSLGMEILCAALILHQPLVLWTLVSL
jgi:hypothetical protein